MAIRRYLPLSAVTMIKALSTAKKKNDNTPVPNRFLSASTEARLNAMHSAFEDAMAFTGIELAHQLKSTADVMSAFDEAQVHISHFFQVFDLGIKRKKFPASARAYYRLDANSAKLPRLSRADDIAEWGEVIEMGDATRVADGGAAMSNPTALEVKTAVDDFNAKNMDQANKKLAYDKAQEAVMKMMPAARKVIKKVWDEVETFYNEERAPSRRRKAREWGIVYTSNVQLTFNFSVTDVNGVPLDHALIELDETNNSAETKAGAAQMKSQVSDEATFIIQHSGFAQQTIKLELPHGKTEFSVGVKMGV